MIQLSSGQGSHILQDIAPHSTIDICLFCTSRLTPDYAGALNLGCICMWRNDVPGACLVCKHARDFDPGTGTDESHDARRCFALGGNRNFD